MLFSATGLTEIRIGTTVQKGINLLYLGQHEFIGVQSDSSASWAVLVFISKGNYDEGVI